MMRHPWFGLAMLVVLAACGSELRPASQAMPLSEAPAPRPQPASDQPAGWKAVLIAGDDQEPAFDNAVEAMARKLGRFGVPRDDITILKADGQSYQVANGTNIRNAFASLDPALGEGCFVFVTSHGAPRQGLVMKRARAYLTPAGLGELLDQSCAQRPTVVIASGCYSGIFADGPPLPATNRTILTAARPDRPSFGCNASLEYTVFDQCVLDSLERGVAWRVVMDRTRACVTARETAMHVGAPSQPQLSVGADETHLRVFSP